MPGSPALTCSPFSMFVQAGSQGKRESRCPKTSGFKCNTGVRCAFLLLRGLQSRRNELCNVLLPFYISLTEYLYCCAAQGSRRLGSGRSMGSSFGIRGPRESSGLQILEVSECACSHTCLSACMQFKCCIVPHNPASQALNIHVLYLFHLQEQAVWDGSGGIAFNRQESGQSLRSE